MGLLAMSSIFIKIFSYDIYHEFPNFLDQFDFRQLV